VEPGVGIEVGDAVEAESMQEGNAALVAVSHASEDVCCTEHPMCVPDRGCACAGAVSVSAVGVIEPVTDGIAGWRNWSEVDAADQRAIVPDSEPYVAIRGISEIGDDRGERGVPFVGVVTVFG